MEKTETKDLNYYKNNCEEDYIKTPISVLRYISELEAAINYTRCCTELPCKSDVVTLVIEEIEKNTSTIIKQIKQVN